MQAKDRCRQVNEVKRLCKGMLEAPTSCMRTAAPVIKDWRVVMWRELAREYGGSVNRSNISHAQRPTSRHPGPCGAAGGYDSGEAVVQAVRCGLTRRLRCRRDLRRLPQDSRRVHEQRPTQNIPHAQRPTQNVPHAQRPTSRHPGPGGSCCELEVTTVAKRWFRQFDAG
jgi:hypothetical protein